MPRDVRMRGFRERASVADVVAWLDARELPRSRESVPLSKAACRVLAEMLVSDVDVPGFPRAAMDGWALCGEDTFGASETELLELRVLGVSLPGAPFDGTVKKGHAVRIMTGAPVPAGADAVLPAEYGTEDGGRLIARGSVPPGRHVGAVGEDIRSGDTLLPAGRTLRPQDVGVAASVGRAELEVFTKPSVAILATGNELAPPGERPHGALIADSNTPMLGALVERDGAGRVAAQRVVDDADVLRDALRASNEDIVLVTGGTSVGQEDHAPRLVAELGELVFHGVALRPAAPTGIGVIDERLVFLLPGNPVSCLCAYDLFAGRAVRHAAGRSLQWPYQRMTGTLTRKVSSVLGRVDYVRATRDGTSITPIMTRGASILSSTTEADGFVLIPQDSEGSAEGSDVEMWLYG